MKIVNLTPHDIVVIAEDGSEIRRYPASGQVARAKTETVVVGEIDGVPVARQAFGDVQGLPDPQPDTLYIVSMVVGQALGGSRTDVLGPDTSPAGAVRDAEGRIIGTRRLVAYADVVEVPRGCNCGSGHPATLCPGNPETGSDYCG